MSRSPCRAIPSIAGQPADYLVATLEGFRSGERQATVTVYYGAFIRDPDGNKIEAVTFPR